MQIKIKAGFAGGTLAAPPSKSMAHRALLCAALANGQSRVAGICASDDMLATMRAMRALGARIVYDADTGSALVHGAGTQLCGGDGVAASVLPPVTCGDGAGAQLCGGGAGAQLCDGAGAAASVLPPVDCGESGSTLRFVIPLFALSGASVTLTGQGRLPERPQGVYADLFAARGLLFAQSGTGITLRGPLPAGEYAVDGSVSSQFISGLLFALPLLDGDSVIRIAPPFESRSYVDLTLRAMADFGVHAAWENEFTIRIKGNQKYSACHYTVEGDCSQAAFFAVLAACLPEHAATTAGARTAGFSPKGHAAFSARISGGEDALSACPGAVTLTNLRADTLQGDRVIFSVLQRCGARLSRGADGSVSVYPSRERLRAADIDLTDCPDLGPVLMVLGLFCTGETVLRGAGRLRLKECDRIAAMQCEVQKLGGKISVQKDADGGDTVRVRGAGTQDGAGAQGSAGAQDGAGAQGGAGTQDGAGTQGGAGTQDGASALHASFALEGHGDHRIVMALCVAALAAGFSADCTMSGAEAVSKSYPHFFDDLRALGAAIERIEDAPAHEEKKA
ncbi:MAG: 3-phosphoshikimate 1-carboxyvinyltransferase [Ruthenibacterium sp.]